MRDRAEGVLRALAGLEVEAGGWRESGPHPYQANAQMHLLEACLAWEALDPAGGWRAAADSVVALARRAFIAPDSGVLREFFEADWRSDVEFTSKMRKGLIAAGIPKKDEAIDTALTMFEVSAMADQAIFTFLVDDL